MSKALIVASVASMIDQFNRPNIKLLKELGFDVHIACNFIEGSTCSSEKIQQLKTDLQTEGVTFSQIDFARKITRITQNLRAYRQIKQLLKQEKYDLIHCHSPIGGLLTRMAAKKYRKSGTKVIYTAHGFHFFKGAPLKNWLLYYPVEWLCAFWTDELITINKEDYARAQKHMHAKHVTYIPGVGVDLKKFSPKLYTDEEILNTRIELGLNDGEKMLLSVGELIPRKDHESVIRALAKINDLHIKYFICGTGELREYLEKLIEQLDLSENIKLLGYRTDISKLCDCADLFVFPSLQEGLPVALMEAMASGLPIVCSCIRGNTDLIVDGRGGYLVAPRDVDGFAHAVKKMIENYDVLQQMREYNVGIIKIFDVERVRKKMLEIYSNN